MCTVLFTVLVIIIILIIIGSSSGGGSSSSSTTSSTARNYQSSSNSTTNSTARNYQSSSNSAGNASKPAASGTKQGSNAAVNQPAAKMVTAEKYVKAIDKTTKLSGVTYEGRQNLLAKMSVYDSISLRRDYHNRYDRNAIGVYNTQNQNIGWIPREIAVTLAPDMDSGVQLFTKIKQISGGNGYNYGIEIIISNDENKIRNFQPVTKKSYPSLSNQNKRNHYDEYYDENTGYLEEIEMRERAEIERDLQREYEEELYR